MPMSNDTSATQTSSSSDERPYTSLIALNGSFEPGMGLANRKDTSPEGWSTQSSPSSTGQRAPKPAQPRDGEVDKDDKKRTKSSTADTATKDGTS